MRKILLKRPNPNNPDVKAYLSALDCGYKSFYVSHSSKGWMVKKYQSSDGLKLFEKKQDAVQFGKKMAKSKKTELIIYKKDGRIHERNSYSGHFISPKS